MCPNTTSHYFNHDTDQCEPRGTYADVCDVDGIAYDSCGFGLTCENHLCKCLNISDVNCESRNVSHAHSDSHERNNFPMSGTLVGSILGALFLLATIMVGVVYHLRRIRNISLIKLIVNRLCIVNG